MNQEDIKENDVSYLFMPTEKSTINCLLKNKESTNFEFFAVYEIINPFYPKLEYIKETINILTNRHENLRLFYIF
jgi:hypothetical protein